MINRLLGILYTLLSKETVTAALLAERYEVSVRTIYRDIECLSQAGIPVYARKGRNGGIALTEQFVLNKMLITGEEQQQILSALLSLEETTASGEREILRKLGNFFQTEPINWIAIDFSGWGDEQKQIYEDLKRAILTGKVICFDYYGKNSEASRRTVEPVQLLFKEYTWYLRAYCRERKAIRFFKLKRIRQLELLEESFEPGNARNPEERCSIENQQDKMDFSGYVTLVMWIDRREAYRVYDRFCESEIEILEDGNFVVRVSYPLDEWVYSLILSFGTSAKVLEPAAVREEVKRRISSMQKRYDSE